METKFESLHAYGEKAGWQEMRFMWDCVARGDVAHLSQSLSQDFVQRYCQLYGNDLSSAIYTVLYLWPQWSHIAICAGVSERDASEIFNHFHQQLYRAASVEEVFRINAQVHYAYTASVAASRQDQQLSPLVRRCRKYIREHVYDRLSIHDIAAAMGYSQSRLAHLYKQETGETIYQRVQQEKIAEAKFLLRSPLLSLNEIQSRLGYASQSHFTRCFKTRTGMAPSKYRSSCHSILTGSAEKP